MITLIIPYYRAPRMLRLQLDTVREYPEGFEVVVVDDCSPEPAADVVAPFDQVALYRITTDRPWNRNGARNLGVYQARTEWVLNVDVDHVLPAKSADLLAQARLNPFRWYKFPRYRVGRADETRRKDALPEDQEFGLIHPHIDSHLMTRNRFLSSPYDERYAGFLGGGSPFLARMKRLYGDADLLPEPICLHVHTRHSVPDASVSDLSRDTSEYKRRRQEIEAVDDTPIEPLNFEWMQIQ